MSVARIRPRLMVCLGYAAVGPEGKGEDRLGGDVEWGGDTSRYYTKPQKTIQSSNKLYKAPGTQYRAPTDYTKPR